MNKKKIQLNELKIGSVLSYAQMAVGIVVGLVYTPLMIRLLGKSEYGLYNMVSSTIAVLSLLSLGFNSGYIKYYAEYKAKKDEQAIAKLNGLFLVIFLVIGGVALACGGFLTCNLELVFGTGLTAQEYKLAEILMLLLTVNLAVSFPMSVFQNIISAHEKFIFLKLLAMMKTVLSPLLTIPLLLLGYGSIAIVVTTLLIAVVTDICYLLYAKRVLKVKFSFGKIEPGMFKGLIVFTAFVAINLLVDQANQNLAKFVLGRFRGTEVVAVYSVGFSLYQYYAMFSTAIIGIFIPRVHNIANATSDQPLVQRRELTDLFIKVGRIQFMILALIITGMVFFGREFIAFWAGEGYEESYYVMLVLVFSAFALLIQNLGVVILRAFNRHQFKSVVYLTMAAVNLGVSIVLCQDYGALGTAIGMAVFFLVADGLIMNIYYYKKCNIDIPAFWKSILRLSLGLVIPVICGIVIKQFFNFYDVKMMFAGIVVYCVIYAASMWLVGMNSYEKGLLIRKGFRRG